jgi:hypothetical protein
MLRSESGVRPQLGLKIAYTAGDICLSKEEATRNPKMTLGVQIKHGKTREMLLKSLNYNKLHVSLQLEKVNET